MNTNRNTSRISNAFLLVLFGVLLTVRLISVSQLEFSWDTFGYYLYLPATVIHHDPLLTDTEWVDAINETYDLTPSVYQITESPEGGKMYFFFMGMSFVYAPGFLIADVIAQSSDAFVRDGYSSIYRYVMVIWMTIVSMIGLVITYRLLIRRFTLTVSMLALVSIIVGTNYLEQAIFKNLEPVGTIFTLIAIIVYFTERWYANGRGRDVVIFGAALGLLLLVKPSEAVAGLIPVFWGVHNRETFKDRLRFLLQHFKQIGAALLVVLVILAPQLIYWYLETGQLVYDSYQNPGVGLDFFAPHFSEVLFSFRKGWFIYTPMIILALAGFIFSSQSRRLFLWVLPYLLVELWVVASWTEWWYGAGFSCRPMIATYPILALGFGGFYTMVLQQKKFGKMLWLLLAALLLAHNLFQMAQIRYSTINLTRGTKAYYIENFLSLDFKHELDSLLLVGRPDGEIQELRNPQAYNDSLVMDTGGVHVPTSESFPLEYKATYGELSGCDHLWFKVRLQIQACDTLDGSDEAKPLLVFTASREEGDYGYRAIDISAGRRSENGSVELSYLSPPMRSAEDEIKVYLWNRQHECLHLGHFEVSVLTPKRCDPL